MTNYTFTPEDINIVSWSSSPKTINGWSLEHTHVGVQITHLPTGLVVRVESERDQAKYRAVALDKLDRILRCTRCDEDGEVIDHLGDWAKCPSCR